jgi:leader peptidase (prepilin peptidase) / N-methyltransferase
MNGIAGNAPVRPRRLIETLVVALAVAAGVLARNGVDRWGVVEALAAGTLVWLAAIDLESRLLPNRIVVPGAVVLLLACGVFESSSFVEHLVAAVVAGGLFFVAAMLRPADLGMGDVKLVFFLGALLGANVLNALAIGFGLVALYALVLVIRQGRSALKQHLPLGPFLAAGAILVLLISPV